MSGNVLFLMADELRFDLPGFMGNPICRTPTLDALAREAVIFDNAYTPSPVCIPARQCLATGKYPRHIRCEYFGDDLDPGADTWPRRFAEAGHYTVACGKLHHRGPDPMQGWLHRIGSEMAVNWPDTPANRNRTQIGRLKWRGAIELAEAGVGQSLLAAHDRYTVDGAVAFLQHFGEVRRQQPAEEPPPVVLKVSLQQPHFPLLADRQRFDYYRSRVPDRSNETAPMHPALRLGALPCHDTVSAEEILNATAAYYAMVEAVDSSFGRVIDAMRSVGQDPDDWTIVFTADHGEMLGEHALWAKRKFYEGSVRIPLFLRAPRQFSGARRRENVNLVDLYPTLCELAEIPISSDLDGRSLVPLMKGRSRDWENETFSQFEGDQFMLKRDNLKYLCFGEWGPDVLFDLASDPSESINQIGDPEYASRVAELRDRLDQFMAPDWHR